MDVPGGGGNLLGQKVGPLPLVAWVGLAGGAVAIWLAVRSRANAASSSGVAGAGISMLDPSSAEAFGTLQQQQQDLTNTLSGMQMGQGQANNTMLHYLANINQALGTIYGQADAIQQGQTLSDTYLANINQGMGAIYTQDTAATASTAANQGASANSLSTPTTA
jgi:hypothetical protein